MVLFVASAGVTFACLDNPYIRAVFASFDAVCPTAKHARTTGLRDAYGELRQVVGAELDDLLQNGVGVMLCTDGWRHKHAAAGQPLLNLVLLKPSGGAIFQGVYSLDQGESKTKQFYVDMHNKMADEVSSGHPEQLLGVIMDGPSVNRAALHDLAIQHPTWICMTCCVHSMNLICKDLSNDNSTFGKHTQVGVFLKQVNVETGYKALPPGHGCCNVSRLRKNF
ncbi:uncharacterized protein HaLaN_16869 [Haematococcus lacustris]|uniref:Uncharacterized protein n=1 Tax=Haematococcus lacustris TaxID=44745 RepID=A0A699ZMW7_HAELA|nr:uncharacterized protein HaLaN_16869 [Haematococcus lacustris]